jgi:hypothetical protein
VKKRRVSGPGGFSSETQTSRNVIGSLDSGWTTRSH